MRQTKKRKDIEEKEKWKAENEFRKTLLQVSGGLILRLSLSVTWRGMNQSQENINGQFGDSPVPVSVFVCG